jgi:hypothetical protein
MVKRGTTEELLAQCHYSFFDVFAMIVLAAIVLAVVGAAVMR